MENLAQITAQLPPTRRSSAGHRKLHVRKVRLKWAQTGSFFIVALVAVIVAMVSVFGGMVAYAPLQNISSGTKSGIVPQWPLLVYGPWMVASLSILRTALHLRRTLHSWFIVLLFSSVAIMLCVAQADRTVTGIAGACLPALASLACFQQLVRQITLTLPPRQGTRRHRR
jgi:quinol-cytochrome oxidoreductase complex cytochrome b subunit